jgi:small ligand-binding sensory domain FIST
MFVHHDDQTVQEDLSKSLIALRKRIQKDTGGFAPKAALYVSCVARSFSQGGNDPAQAEMQLIRDVPLARFYAGGEISNARLYGYTGILTLFL